MLVGHKQRGIDNDFALKDKAGASAIYWGGKRPVEE